MAVHTIFGTISSIANSEFRSNNITPLKDRLLYGVSTEFGVQNADGSRTYFEGVGLTYDWETGTITGGTISRVAHYGPNGEPQDEIVGLSVDSAIVNAFLSGMLGGEPYYLYGSEFNTGNDIIDARHRANDALIDDRIYGGEGRDTIFAGSGNDRVFGGDRNDRILGGDGDDTLVGDAGNDVLFGESGDDELLGTFGNDRLFGGSGNDSLYGGSAFATDYEGDDYLNGGSGDDLLRGNEGHDELVGGDGKDNLQGDEGNDVVSGGAKDDIASGGSGDDFVYGGAGNDQAFGGEGDDAVKGDSCDDRVFGNSGNDSLYGGAGLDSMTGDVGNDLLSGGTGADNLSGGAGEDRLWGGSGDDLLNGGADGDVLNGGTGIDTAVFVSANFADLVILHTQSGFKVGSTPEGPDTLISVERIMARDGTFEFDASTCTWSKISDVSSIDDTKVFGTEGADVLGFSGQGGAPSPDYVYGFGGDDIISFTGDPDLDPRDQFAGRHGFAAAFGGDGNDTLQTTHLTFGVYTFDGGEGNDTIVGGRYNDTLIGGNGDDAISAGSGDDILTGGDGADTFTFRTYNNYRDTFGNYQYESFGADTVTDFEVGVDKLNIVDLVSSSIVDTAEGLLVTVESYAGRTLSGIPSGGLITSTILLEGIHGSVSLNDLMLV